MSRVRPKIGFELPDVWDNQGESGELEDTVPALATSASDETLPKLATVEINPAAVAETRWNDIDEDCLQRSGRDWERMSVDTFTSVVAESRRRTPDDVVKRGLDIGVALLAITALSLPISIIALAIKCTDGGPIFYSQERVGRGGNRFKFFKFRSMVTNADALKDKLLAHNEADGPIFKMKNDPRITPVGRVIRKWSLDELPQLWNVLRGDMSLVGPRPHLPREIAEYKNYPAERLSVQPGLLCLREVTGRSELTFEAWIASDLEYIEKRSLWLDIQILLKAIPAILLAKGAY